MATPAKSCSVPGCNSSANKAGYGARGMCRRHYGRWQRHGDPLAGASEKGAALRFIREVAIPHQSDECLIWPLSKTPSGYGQLRIQGRAVGAHREVCERAHGPAPTPEHQAAHSCGRGHEGCVSPVHLRWATHSENQLDRSDHGTSNRGEANHFDKLSADQVREIRRLQGQVSQKALAERFSVSRSNIQAIQYRRSWAWLH